MAKHAKKKGMRRAYLKRFSSQLINGTQSIDKARLNDLNYHGRAQAMVDEKYLKNLFALLGYEWRPEQPNEPRREVLALIQKMADNVPIENHIQLINNHHKQIVMFYRPGTYWLIEKNLELRIIRRSIRYTSRETLFDTYRKNRVVWVEAKKVLGSE